ncbi:MAG TPA: NfeD family protein [Micromonosporaceae bacterium]|nr:NfeD family protein [Micromonosporaceae bacterium]
MNEATLTFLVIGALGALVVAASLLFGDRLPFTGPDANGLRSPEVSGGFAAAFGFAGAVAYQVLRGRTTVPVLTAAAIGVVVAVPIAYAAWRLSRTARGVPADPPSDTGLVGRRGLVVTPIPHDGYGEVRLRIGRRRPVKLRATASVPIPIGTHVYVVEVPDETSVVVEESGMRPG